MRASLPAYICLAAQLYFCWAVVRAKPRSADRKPAYTIEITVHGPDGKIIPAIRPR